jgi:hypothetical protein
VRENEEQRAAEHHDTDRQLKMREIDVTGDRKDDDNKKN